MKSVLVTGATGNVGVEVVRQLVSRGVPVKAAVRTGRGHTAPQDTSPVVFDFETPETFGPALDGVDRVFLMRPPHMSDAKAFRPFIHAMAAAGIQQVVFLSVQGAGQNIFVPHHGIEVLLKRSGLAWTFLRPSFFMQNLSTTHLADIRDHGEIYVPAGRGRTNFIDVADIGEAAAVCLSTPGHQRMAYEITGTEALTYDQVAATLSAACGRPITYPRPSSREFKAHMRAAGHNDEFIGVMGSIYAIARFGMAAGATNTFERLVGRSPCILKDWVAGTACVWQTDAYDESSGQALSK
ncbi:MAG: SDR family oxidoreductase [Coriobacteriia bacterium]